MKNLAKVLSIIEAVIVIVCGVLIACGYNGEIVDLMVGISLTLLGVDFLAMCFTINKNFAIGLGIAGAASLSLGIALMCNSIGFAETILTILIVMGMGIGLFLVLFGFIRIAMKDVRNGLFLVIGGAILATLAFLMYFIGGFRQAFWIIAGILIAIYGIFTLISIIVPSVSKKLRD